MADQDQVIENLVIEVRPGGGGRNISRRVTVPPNTPPSNAPPTALPALPINAENKVRFVRQTTHTVR